MAEAQPGSEAAIREQAYYFWEQDGRPDGREMEYWARAMAAVTSPKKATRSKAAVKPKAPGTKATKATEPKLKAAASKAKAAPVKAAKAEPKAKPKKK